MVQIILTVLRAVAGVMLALAGFISAIWGLYFLGRKDSQLLGSEGFLLLIGLLVATALGAGAWKLFRGIARPARAAGQASA
jgi:hypothetical protein